MPDTPGFPANEANEADTPDDGTTTLSRPVTHPVVATAARPPARMRTMVFGLILLVVAGVVLVGQLTSIHVDAGLVVLALMVGAGLLLILGSRRAAS